MTVCACVVLALAAFAPSGCSADDGDLEGYKCDINKPRDQQCIAGFICKCEGGALDKCFCTKTAALSQRASGVEGPERAQPTVAPAAQIGDPSAELLRRLYGLELTRR